MVGGGAGGFSGYGEKLAAFYWCLEENREFGGAEPGEE